MKPIRWLAKVPKYAIPGVVWVTEIVGGVILKAFGGFDTVGQMALFFVGSGILAHYIHLLVEHLRPRKREDLLETFDGLHAPDRGTAERENMRGALEAVIDSGGALRPGILKTATRLTAECGRSDDAGQQQMTDWLSLLERFDRQGMSREFITQLSETLKRLKVPRQVESIFTSSLSKEAARMAELAQQRPVEHVDLVTQYVYASGVAEYYERQARVGSIYATALDVPSVFYKDHHDYFKKQQPLLTATDRFVRYATDEVRHLRWIVDALNGKSTPRPARYAETPAEKSRLVIIGKTALCEDLETDGFWAFVEWHAQHHFGLKFFVRDQDDSDDWHWYETTLDDVTGLDRKETIDDFIVYGEECVFGRVYSEPDDQGRVTLGFHHAARAATGGNGYISSYRRFFERLWNERRTHTLTDLWHLPFVGRERLRERKRFEALLQAYLDAFLKAENDNQREAS